MRTREQVESKIAEQKEMMGSSDELDEKLRTYISALEWVRDGELEEISRLRKSEHDPHFDEIIVGGRTDERKIFPQLKTDEPGVYVISRIDQRELFEYE